VIDPKDTRRVLGLALAIAYQAEDFRDQTPMDYGVFRM